MARARVEKGCWADLAQPGARLEVRVTPGARQETATRDGDHLAIAVQAPPEDGKANEAVRRLLARALGVAPSRLDLAGGATSRDKLFRLLP